MSTWRRKVIEIAPELKQQLENEEELTIIFSYLLDLLKEAHSCNDTVRIKQIYDYAEWCFHQKEKTLWNGAGVGFYEHLGDHEIIFSEFPKWVKKEIYEDIRGLLAFRNNPERMKILDKYYTVK